ncbi:hypothetical protein OEZ85_003687 [Tetradesmus obliquus]|uniref:AB hydrolase-1 domain-containing protein n=1 Tax=Tetradesmus obliquus TaxID=3088 RepID=A0ABY8UF29_TETOB|nr:hypothetical protein OEZ85_003687 [Tetradesmus obliquus]
MVVVEAALAGPAIAIGAVGLAAVLAWLDAQNKSKKPELIYSPTPFNTAVMSRCPTLHSVYQCTPFLTNGHVETIVVAKARKPPGVDYRREMLITKDGGAVAIDWEHHDDAGKDLPADAPVLILFPGLTGGSGDSYVQHAVLQARHAGIRAAVFNSRGTADSPVLTPQFYSASFTGDTREVVDHVHKRFPNSTLFAAGWSLGANILVNYLGEQGEDTPIEAAVSMCNPFDLTISNKQINEGFNKIYNWNLAAGLKRIFAKHHLVWRGHSGPAQPQLVPTCTTIREFDEAITVHSFNWEDVDAYYAGSSSAKRIPAVRLPLLCIQALDDPIAPAEAIPCDAIQDNPYCMLAVTPCGGHLGWASGPGAPFQQPCLERPPSI